MDIVTIRNLCKELPSKYQFNIGKDGFPVRTGDDDASVGFNIIAEEYSEAQEHIENIHNKLLEDNIWIWTHGTFDQHLDLPSKKEGGLATFLEKIENEGCKNAISDYDGVKKMVDWIRNR